MTLLPEVEISGIFTGEPLELTTKVTQLFYTLFARQIAENNIFQKYPEHVLRLALLHAGYTVQDADCMAYRRRAARLLNHAIDSDEGSDLDEEPVMEAYAGRVQPHFDDIQLFDSWQDYNNAAEDEDAPREVRLQVEAFRLWRLADTAAVTPEVRQSAWECWISHGGKAVFANVAAEKFSTAAHEALRAWDGRLALNTQPRRPFKRRAQQLEVVRQAKFF